MVLSYYLNIFFDLSNQLNSLVFKLIYSMQLVFIIVMLMLISKNLPCQENFNLELLANIRFDEDGNDCWGFVDDYGNEYAVIGTRTATRIFSLKDPRNPQAVYTVPGASSIWRDIKYFNKHLYVTTDQGKDGLLIIDVSGAPDNFSHKFWKPFVVLPTGQDTLFRAHNIYIDENGIAYLSGHNIPRRGVFMLDLKEDPKEPKVIGAVNLFYSHDAYARGDTLYSSELNNGFAIYDVSDKSNPQELARITTSSNFTHNAWISDDGEYAFTTDEVRYGYVDAYDISDINNIKFKSKFRPLETKEKPVIPHNTHYFQGYNVVSWYTDGLVIIDAHRPENLVKIAAWDTHPDDGILNPNTNWFRGCWGAYPYLPSGLVIASDINTGLYIFRPEYKRAAYLEGNVYTEDENGNKSNIRDAKIEIVSSQPAFAFSDFSGAYKTGLAGEGTFEVRVTHPNFENYETIITLKAGEVTVLNVKLSSTFLKGIVIDEETEQVLSDVSVVLVNESTGASTAVSTDASGIFAIPAKRNENYRILVAKWGYLHEVVSISDWIEIDSTVLVRLKRGYQDDFFADLGWQLTKTVSAGNWDRGIPEGTLFNGDFSNPPSDSDTDLGEEAYVTGYAGGDPGFNDVDGGETELTSPAMDFTKFQSVEISYRTWFFNSGGAGTPPNDLMRISLSNGESIIILEEIKTSSAGWTSLKSFVVDPTKIPFTDNMSIVITAADYDPGHLLEAGFDQFSVLGEVISSIHNEDFYRPVVLFPNPAVDFIDLVYDDIGIEQVSIISANGKLFSLPVGPTVYHTKRLNIGHLPHGIYWVEMVDKRGKIIREKFIKL